MVQVAHAQSRWASSFGDASRSGQRSEWPITGRWRRYLTTPPLFRPLLQDAFDELGIDVLGIAMLIAGEGHGRPSPTDHHVERFAHWEDLLHQQAVGGLVLQARDIRLRKQLLHFPKQRLAGRAGAHD